MVHTLLGKQYMSMECGQKESKGAGSCYNIEIGHPVFDRIELPLYNK